MDVTNYTTIEAMLKPAEVALLLKVSKKHVFNLMKEGRLKAVNVGNAGAKIKRWRFKAEDIRALIDKV